MCIYIIPNVSNDVYITLSMNISAWATSDSLSSAMVDNEDNNSHNHTLLHEVIKLRLLFNCFDWETLSGGNDRTYCAFKYWITGVSPCTDEKHGIWWVVEHCNHKWLNIPFSYECLHFFHYHTEHQDEGWINIWDGYLIMHLKGWWAIFALRTSTCKAGSFHRTFNGFCGVTVDHYSEIRPFW